MSEASQGETALTVSALNRKIASVLAGAFTQVWVRGEVSNLRQQASGHVYFSLKDRQSQISAVLFRGQAQRLATAPRDGMEVLILAEISVYEPRGSYQIIVRDLIDDGLGKLQRAFLALRRKLEAEGLFAPSGKQAIPGVPRTVGVVTSPTGAALRDICSVLAREHWSGRLIVFPTLVQGESAAPMIARAIAIAGAFPEMELLLVARGGGSLEDLWPFNEEEVVRAVAACPVPVISAVGHEIDTVLTDLAADWRSPTPTAAAEKVAAGLNLFRERYARLAQALQRSGLQVLGQLHKELKHWQARLTPRVLTQHNEHALLKVDKTRESLEGAVNARVSGDRLMLASLIQRLGAHHPASTVRSALRILPQWEKRLHHGVGAGLRRREERVVRLREHLRGLSLGGTLKRGFAVVRDADRKVIRQAADLSPSGPLTILFADGEVQGEWRAATRKSRD